MKRKPKDNSNSKKEPAASPPAHATHPKVRKEQIAQTTSPSPSPEPLAEKPNTLPPVSTRSEPPSPPAAVSPSAAASKPAKPGKRRVAAVSEQRRAEIKVPAILLEGDLPPPPPASGPGARYALAPQPVTARSPQSTGELPEAYGTGRIFLAARDPHWLYASWDLTHEQQRAMNASSRDGHLVLRLFSHPPSRSRVPEVHVHPESKNWFVNVPEPETRYHAEIGFYQPSGVWKSVSVSQSTFTPPATPSPDATAEFATIPPEISFQQIVEMVQEFATESQPLLEAVALATEAQKSETNGPEISSRLGHGSGVSASSKAASAKGGRAHTPLPIQITPGQDWTSAQMAALRRLIHIDGYRRVWMGSMEITELVRRQLEEEIASIAAAEGRRIRAVPEAIPPGINISSEMRAEARKPRSFWFKVNAELILYGATESDAKVTIAGRPIKLRPDGTFSFRFSLPDGRYHLPALAVSSDGAEAREARLEFSRSTEYQGHVEPHPQPETLRPPRAEHTH